MYLHNMDVAVSESLDRDGSTFTNFKGLISTEGVMVSLAVVYRVHHGYNLQLHRAPSHSNIGRM